MITSTSAAIVTVIMIGGSVLIVMLVILLGFLVNKYKKENEEKNIPEQYKDCLKAICSICGDPFYLSIMNVNIIKHEWDDVEDDIKIKCPHCKYTYLI